jgi:pimeloyl-ACP methyl ester carboxylesterase
MQRPSTSYVGVGGGDVAYQIFGDGPTDLLWCYGLGGHVDSFWDIAAVADYMQRLASFTRVITFDRRGTGASDAVPDNAIPTWEEWAEDIGAVLDAAGSEQAVIFASLDAGPMAVLYTVSHPERVSALIFSNTSARYMVDDDYPIGYGEESVDSLIDLVRTGWGTSDFAKVSNPEAAEDAQLRDAMARQQRASATPRAAAAQYEYILRSVDVRSVLPFIRIPTLILHARDFSFVPLEHARYMAEHIGGAKLVELPGAEVFAPTRLVIAEVTEFLTGSRPIVEVDRVLASILFTDIVQSTERAALLGDRRWKSLLDEHNAIVREQLRRFRGREVNTTGDGFVASFDGPARAIRCAQAVIQDVETLGLELRMGLHTGECEIRGEDLGGLAVHIAARVGAIAAPHEVLVSNTVKDLVVGSGIEFVDRGESELKGVPGSWRLFAVA